MMPCVFRVLRIITDKLGKNSYNVLFCIWKEMISDQSYSLSPAGSSVCWCRSCFICSGLIYEIQWRWSFYVNILCELSQCNSSPIYKKCWLCLCTPLHSCWRFRTPQEYGMFLLLMFYLIDNIVGWDCRTILRGKILCLWSQLLLLVVACSCYATSPKVINTMVIIIISGYISKYCQVSLWLQSAKFSETCIIY